MKYEQFKALFPLKGVITQEIIDKANIWDTGNCIGALTLKAALGENVNLLERPDNMWGLWTGNQVIEDKDINITTEEGIDMTSVRDPQEVTFIVQL